MLALMIILQRNMKEIGNIHTLILLPDNELFKLPQKIRN